MAQSGIPQKLHHIVVGFDFSEIAERAVEQAIQMAEQRTPAELHVVVVALQSGPLLLLPEDSAPLTEEAARETVRKRVARLIEDHRERLGTSSIEQMSIYVLPGLSTGQTGHLIAEVAKEIDAEVIVVGSHGRKGINRLLLGSVAERVVREATASVFVVRPTDFVGAKKVPEIQPPLAPGEPHLKHFQHRRTYHLADRSSDATKRTMPAT